MNMIIICNLYSIAPMNKNADIYVDETENNVHRLEFHSSFHVVFLTIVW